MAPKRCRVYPDLRTKSSFQPNFLRFLKKNGLFLKKN
jgi:hypothetical protein